MTTQDEQCDVDPLPCNGPNENTYISKTKPTSPGYYYSEMSGFTQFYAGFITGCPEEDGDCAYGNWEESIQWAASSAGQAVYEYDISSSAGYNKNGHGSTCRAQGEYHPYYNPHPLYVCDARGLTGVYIDVE